MWYTYEVNNPTASIKNFNTLAAKYLPEYEKKESFTIKNSQKNVIFCFFAVKIIILYETNIKTSKIKK